ncbi:zinc finger protein 469-like [Fukomys damarensis]|uniref:zinc finger protein 469-like n=1 Tax=Fukomys damarensis TaxID=885580 RepID=UPI0008FECD5B|nr:zinc finger protein 469-like [Fukomys damarensis]
MNCRLFDFTQTDFLEVTPYGTASADRVLLHTPGWAWTGGSVLTIRPPERRDYSLIVDSSEGNSSAVFTELARPEHTAGAQQLLAHRLEELAVTRYTWRSPAAGISPLASPRLGSASLGSVLSSPPSPKDVLFQLPGPKKPFFLGTFPRFCADSRPERTQLRSHLNLSYRGGRGGGLPSSAVGDRSG